MTETLSPALPGDIEAAVHAVLKAADEQGMKLVTAESCTGGMLASLLTDVDGRGHAFERGFVPYTDEAKHALLDVPRALLERFTAVSAPVAEAMATGALARSNGDMALAITGFAGRGSPGEEPGLVYFALARRDSAPRVEEAHFGDIGRGPVRLACLRQALKMLQSELGDSA